MKLFEKLKHPSEKTKHRLQGGLFGFFAGAILTLTIVGAVGCSMTEESTQPVSASLSLEAPKKAWTESTTYSFYALLGPWSSSGRGVSNISPVVPTASMMSSSGFTLSYSMLGSFAESMGTTLTEDFLPYRASWYISPVSYTSSSTLISSYPYVVFGYRTGANSPYTYKWTDAVDMRTLPADLSGYYIDFTAGASSASSRPVTTWEQVFKPLSNILFEEEEEASSLSSSPVLDRSLAFTFSDSNPFSAWARNPMSHDPATNYDAGAPWLLYTGKPSGSGATTLINSEARDFLVGSFYIAGNPSAVFDTIQVITINLSTDNAFVVNGSTEAVQISADQFARGAFMVTSVKYVNSETDNSLVVYNFGSTSATLNGNAVNALTSGAWANVGYRQIVWSGGDLTISINGYEAPCAWWLEFNALSSQSGVATMILGDSNTGVFGLIASAFTCWGSIFSLAIVPGLTIGTLLFVPLVVLIVFSIIKLLQK